CLCVSICLCVNLPLHLQLIQLCVNLPLHLRLQLISQMPLPSAPQYATSLIYPHPSFCFVTISIMASGTTLTPGRSWLTSTLWRFIVPWQAAKVMFCFFESSAIFSPTVDFSFMYIGSAPP